MLYQRTLVVPANTPETAPVSDTLKLCAGVSVLREVAFPAGCCGYVHVHVNDAGWQLIPWSRDEWLASDDDVVEDNSPYPMFTVPYMLTIYGYNEDTVNDHTVTLRVIMHEGEATELTNLQQLMDALRGY